MKRIAAAVCALAVALCLSPAAFADTALARPGQAQRIYITTEEFESYRADFYLSAVSKLAREGDDLALYFESSEILLRGFFATREERRGLSFADGAVISAADFDENGQFTGKYHSGFAVKRTSAEPKTLGTGEKKATVTVKKQHNINEITSSDGAAVYGALRAAALAAADERTALGCSWNDIDAISFDMEANDDGSVTLIRETTECANGVTIINRRPDTVHAADSGTLVPVGRGRASLTYKNALGEALQTLSIRVTDDKGALNIECTCPECGGEQGAKLHMLPCGHYTCCIDDEGAHRVAECNIAGHCTTDGASHGKCSNCLKPLCTGNGHGTGICQHEHTWQQYSYRSPSATEPGESVAKCVSCGITYSQILPATGG